MNIRFCFKYEVKHGGCFFGSFKSTDGEKYAVKMQSILSFDKVKLVKGFYTDLKIEWRKQSCKFLRVSIVSKNNVLVNNKTRFITDELCTVIIYSSSDSICGNILVAIDVDSYPCIDEQPVTKPADENLTATKEGPVIEKKLEQLSIDIKNFLQTGEFSDVVLTDGSNEIRAHKFILCARSSVFSKMFQHPMKENRENRITIEDISHETLKELLDFMYAGTVVIKDSIMAQDLYVAADKYDVKDLRDICATMLKSVNLNSVYDTLLLADLYSDKMLKEAALDFISNNSSQLKAAQSWSSFMKEHHNLAVEILNLLIDKKI